MICCLAYVSLVSILFICLFLCLLVCSLVLLFFCCCFSFTRLDSRRVQVANKYRGQLAWDEFERFSLSLEMKDCEPQSRCCNLSCYDEISVKKEFIEISIFNVSLFTSINNLWLNVLSCISFLFVNLKSSMPAHYKYFPFFFLVKSCGSDHLESICYDHYAHLLFSLRNVNLCSLYILLFISMLAVVNDINSAKIKNLASWICTEIRASIVNFSLNSSTGVGCNKLLA